MDKAFEYRIYPDAAQRKSLARTFGSVRYVYNRALAMRKTAYKNDGVTISTNTLITRIPEWKKEEGTAWLAEADSMALQQSVRDLDKAYRNFFRRPGKTGFPRFKSKRGRRSYRTNRVAVTDDGHIKLPKIGTVKARISRPLEGRALSATVKQVPSGKYFVAVCCTDVERTPLPGNDHATGVDMGINYLMVTSDGEFVENPGNSRRHAGRLAREQRRPSRRRGARRGERQSNNYKRQKQKVALIHEKIANSRKDTLHKATTRLVNENQVICVETLAPKNMVKNRRLAKSLHDAAFGELIRQLKYKTGWYGREFVQVDRFHPSSKTCSVCGGVQAMPLNMRTYRCQACGSSTNRDLNAARNILQEGLRLLGRDAPEAKACGESVSLGICPHVPSGSR